MLEVIILKTRHGGDTEDSGLIEAKKIFPYLESFDAFSPESLLRTKEQAEASEARWQSYLASSPDRHALAEKLRFPNRTKHTSAQFVYVTEIMREIMRKGITLYTPERWENDSEARRLTGLLRESSDEYDRGVNFVRALREDEGVRVLYDSFKKMLEVIDARDSHIASNLNQAEAIIRSTYPHLQEREVIRLGMQIGYAHRIEQFGNIQITSIPLLGTNEDLAAATAKVYDLLRQNAPFDSVRPWLLRVGKLA